MLSFGLLGVVTTVLDLLWQIVFPLLGFPDYNDLVFKSVKHGDGGHDDKDQEVNGEQNGKGQEVPKDEKIE